jgi:ERCC4-type nuclease
MKTISSLPYKYTKKERKELLKSLTVLIDTRENKTGHITQYFDKHGISYKTKKLNFGDYSFIFQRMKKQGLPGIFTSMVK